MPAGVQVAAVPASPYRYRFPGEHPVRSQVVGKLPVALLVLSLGNADDLPGIGGPLESLLAGGFGKPRVETGTKAIDAKKAGLSIVERLCRPARRSAGILPK